MSRGRRSASEDTRAALLEAARRVFGEQGFHRTTVRAIAARAGLNASMVNYWFGGKQGLFAAAVAVPFDVVRVVDGLLADDPATLDQRLLRTFLTVWDQHREQFAAMVHSVSSQQAAADMLREFLTTTVFRRVVQHIAADRAELRAALCASQIIGLAMMRYVLRLEPLASADVEGVVRAIAPTVRHYLTGDV